MPSPKTTAAIGVVLSGATAVVTNLVTTRWSPALAAAAVVLVAAGAAVAAASSGPGRSPGTSGRFRARRRGVIDRSRMTLGHNAEAHIEAAGTSEVTNLKITLDDGEAAAKATGHSKIRNSSITQKKP
jgi:hypothetical protein